mgnify:FL=1
MKKKGRTREGKGFSVGELKEAEVDSAQAIKSGIAVDLRRKTKREENVQLLREYFRSLIPKRKPKKAPKKIPKETLEKVPRKRPKKVSKKKPKKTPKKLAE